MIITTIVLGLDGNGSAEEEPATYKVPPHGGILWGGVPFADKPSLPGP